MKYLNDSILLIPDRMWILGRTREIDATVRAHIYAIMEELKLDSDRLIISKNNNCTTTDHITNHIRAIN